MARRLAPRNSDIRPEIVSFKLEFQAGSMDVRGIELEGRLRSLNASEISKAQLFRVCLRTECSKGCVLFLLRRMLQDELRRMLILSIKIMCDIV